MTSQLLLRAIMLLTEPPREDRTGFFISHGLFELEWARPEPVLV